jgi:TatD DNase family protein
VLIDSHCHLNYLVDCDTRLAAARAMGVSGFLCIGVKRDTHAAVVDIAERHDDVWASAGIHPESVQESADVDWIAAALTHRKIVGIGETGLDYGGIGDGRCGTRDMQRASFAAHLALAHSNGLPVIVHTRAADDDTRDLLQSHRDSIGVLHCFTESWELARAALDLGWYISISGIVTFRNAANVREVARRIPDDRLLVETDCPWLAPVPHRGKTNEPAYVTHTAAFLAALRNRDPQELALQTSNNFRRLFTRAVVQRGGNSSSNSL